nr:hypothetical protein [Tanacetum cinerariifolium]
MCDVPCHDNSSPLDVSKDQIEDFSESNKEFSSINDDSFSIDDIHYVETSPPDSELVSSEVMEIVIPEVGGIDDDILLMIKDDDLHEKLRNVNLLISKIEALNANSTPSSDCKTKSFSTSLNSLLEETNTCDNSLPEFKLSALMSDSYELTDELISFISAPEYDCFLFKDEPNSKDFTKDVEEFKYQIESRRVSKQKQVLMLSLGRGKGFLRKKGAKIAIERVSIPKMRRTKTVTKETSQSKKVAYEVDFEATDKEDEIPLVQRRYIGVVIGSEARHETDKEGLDHSKKLTGVGRISKWRKATKKGLPKYSATPFDQTALDIYDQKDKLFKMMRECKAYNRHPPYKALYDALVVSLKETVKEPKQEEVMDDEEPTADEVVNTEENPQDDSSLNQDRSKWFKQSLRPENPDLDWYKEPNADAGPKHTWFNDLVYAEKDPLTFDIINGNKEMKYDASVTKTKAVSQNQRDLPRDTLLVRVEVLRHDTKRLNVRLETCYPTYELSSEKTQHGDNEDALVNIEGVKELKRIVRIKGVKKEALYTLRQKPGQCICYQNHKVDCCIQSDDGNPSNASNKQALR